MHLKLLFLISSARLLIIYFSSAETNIESQPMVDTHSKRTLLIKTVETRDGQVGSNFWPYSWVYS